jgi:hypothetical protein
MKPDTRFDENLKIAIITFKYNNNEKKYECATLTYIKIEIIILFED